MWKKLRDRSIRAWKWLRAEGWRIWKDPKAWVLDFPERFDGALRRFDLRSHRIDETLWHQKGFLEGYSRTAFWLPAVVLFFLAYGLPRAFDLRWWEWPWFILIQRGWPLLGVFGAAMVAHLLACRFAKGRLLPRVQWLVLLAVSVGVFAWAGDETRQIDPKPYEHTFAIFGIIVLTVAMPANRWLADRWVLGGRKKDFASERQRFRLAFAANLARTQLFVGSPTPDDELQRREQNLGAPPEAADRRKWQRKWSRLARAFSLVPLTSPVLLVINSAITALVIPRRFLWVGVLIVLLVSWCVLAAAHFRARLSAFLEIARQLVVRGGPGVVSTVVLLLAALRLANVDYVTTVLDQSSKWVLFGFVVMLYYLFWLYEYWSQRALSEVLLGLLHTPEKGQEDGQQKDKDNYPAWIHYPKHGQSTAKSKQSKQEKRARRLQIHGNGRLIAIEEKPDRKYPPENFQAHPALEVFSTIHRQLICRARLGRGVDWTDADLVGDALHRLAQRVRLYRVVPALLIGVLAGVTLVMIFTRVQEPVIEAQKHARGASPFQLTEALKKHEGEPEVYAVAASGGGTRAALYTYSVLRALHEREVIHRVVMASGVSGGSLGLAYYAAHRDELHEAEPSTRSKAEAGDDPWRCYRAATVAPYIRDVLAGVGEWRLITGTRLGKLLTEGFTRELFPGDKGPPGCKRDPRRTLAALGAPDVGYVFNSSLSGLWDPDSEVAQDCLEDGPPLFFWRREAKKRDCASVASRGSRLALTNVASFTQEGVNSTFAGWKLDFDYQILDDPNVTFAEAASVNANFPPIFSNAAILVRERGDKKDEETTRDARYWVTDGGAVENRGVLSLLLALRAEIPKTNPEAADPVPCLTEPEDRRADDETWIKVIVAEAAGGSEGYSEDRGTATALGAAKEISDKLIPELARQVDRAYCRWKGGRARVKMVYLPMPTAVARAFGTHWQLLTTTTVADPSRWYEPGPELLKPWTWFSEHPGPSPWSWLAVGPPEITLSGDEMLEVVDHLFSEEEKRRKIKFKDPSAGRYLWDWIAQGADAGADKDPRVHLEQELGD